MATPQDVQALEAMLLEELPGGKWIQPHWQDGPFWLVPVTDTRGAHGQVEAVLAAHDPIATGLTILPDPDYSASATVYAVSQFCYELLSWHRDEDGLQYAHENVIGPLAAMPGPTDVMENLVDLVGLTLEEADNLAPVLATLKGAHAPSAVAALAAVNAPRKGNAIECVTAALAAAAGILTP